MSLCQMALGITYPVGFPAFLDIFAQPVFRTTGLARTAKGSTAARQLCGTRRSHGAAASLSRRAALGGGEVA